MANCNNDCVDVLCQDDGCKPIDTSCVIYNIDESLPSQLLCLGEDIVSGTSLTKILVTISDLFCSQNNHAVLQCVKEKLEIEEDFLPTTQLLTAIQNFLCNLEDSKVKVTPSDTTTGYLFDKVVADQENCLIKTVVTNPSTGEQQLKISINFPCLLQRIPACFEIETSGCITVEEGVAPCVPAPYTPVISRIGSTLKGTNCNGTLYWYDLNGVLVGTGNNFTAESQTSYYATCHTYCGESVSSNIIAVPPLVTYNKVRVAVFTRNNCGVNLCNTPCVGSSITFSKTYTSLVSQEVVNSIAENDMSFAVEGQDYINTMGACSCPDCNCVFPTYNQNFIINNATCNNDVVNANGQITIVGISGADKFGYSFGSGPYTGLPYSSAITLSNFNQGNVETTPTTVKVKALSTETRVVFRLYNGAADCYKEIVVNHLPPDCTKEEITIGDTTVSCEAGTTPCKNWTIVMGNTGGLIATASCTSGAYEFVQAAPNVTIEKCSPYKPQVTGGTATQNGLC